MELEALRAFLGWCTLFNFGILIYWYIMVISARDWVYRLHSRWFPISREAFNTAMYCFIGSMKLLVLFFNLIPYLALRMLGSN